MMPSYGVPVTSSISRQTSAGPRSTKYSRVDGCAAGRPSRAGGRWRTTTASWVDCSATGSGAIVPGGQLNFIAASLHGVRRQAYFTVVLRCAGRSAGCAERTAWDWRGMTRRRARPAAAIARDPERTYNTLIIITLWQLAYAYSRSRS